MTERNPNKEQLRQSALKMLTRRSLTVKELTERLRRKGAGKAVAGEIAFDFLKSGYIDEKAIVEDHIKRGREAKLVGRFLLSYELRQRGINAEMVDELLSKLYPENDELEIARQFAARKMSGMQDLPPDKRERRLAGSLQRRGFQQDTIAAIMRYESVKV